MNKISYEPNSHKSKEESTAPEKRVEKVVSGVVKTRKKSEIRKFADVFISEDVSNVKSYVVKDVIIPAIKKAIVDVVTDGVHMIFYGGTKRGNSRPGDKVSYVNYSKSGWSSEPRSSESKTEYSSDIFVFETRGDAEDALAQMDAIVEKYRMVRVLDLYDIVGKTCDHTATKYGWTSTRNAEIVRVRDGYVIRMPRPVPID